MKAYYGGFELNAKYVGVKGAPWDSLNKDQWQIVVYNLNTKKWTMFDYWAREIDTPKDVLEAFCYWLEDCNAGCYDFITFVDNYGYTDLRHAKKIYNACVKACRKWRRVSEMTERETIYFLDDLREENDI